MNVDLGLWNKLTRLVVFLLFVAGLLGVAVWYRPLIQHNENYRKRIFDLDQQVRQAEENNRHLERTIQAMRHDPRAVERIAREKLGYARPGEMVIRFEDPAADSFLRSLR